ncbi:MAG TPA: tryptophan 7-halogenase, partial [Thermoanaerobaculia bacterium]|nr:tryptophan 7-halogenase [Thermoanaerobaculia bacterium]
MRRPLAPDDLLYRDPSSQAIALPDGRLLVRHARGLSLLHGVDAGDLRRALGGEGGLRVADVVADLEETYGKDGALRLLSSLIGELVHVAEPVKPAVDAAGSGEVPPPLPWLAGGTVAVVGTGPAARRFAERLERAGSLSVPLLEPGAIRDGERLRGVALAVCIPEEATYRDLFTLQRACLAAGVPSLFLTADPDGLRAGPLTVPGVSPCLACAQAAAFRFLRLEPSTLLAALEQFRTGEAGSGFPRAEAALADETRRVLAGGEPSLLTEVLWLTPGGEARRLPVERVPGCPVCGGEEAPSVEDPLAARASLVVVETQDRAVSRAFPADPEGLVTSVGILGGGTAGYLAAMALRRKVPHVEVTLIESSDVPVIGVGEATTPLMPQFLHVDLGLDVHQLFREVQPTFKLGIRFLWGEPGTGDFTYPFGPVHLLEPAVYGGDVRDCSLQSLLMMAGAMPIYKEGAAWTSRMGTEVAYHLDNERFV